MVVSDEEQASDNITSDSLHGEWDYTTLPSR
jgi:hypothetical protein